MPRELQEGSTPEIHQPITNSTSDIPESQRNLSQNASQSNPEAAAYCLNLPPLSTDGILRTLPVPTTRDTVSPSIHFLLNLNNENLPTIPITGSRTSFRYSRLGDNETPPDRLRWLGGDVEHTNMDSIVDMVKREFEKIAYDDLMCRDLISDVSIHDVSSSEFPNSRVITDMDAVSSQLILESTLTFPLNARFTSNIQTRLSGKFGQMAAEFGKQVCDKAIKDRNFICRDIERLLDIDLSDMTTDEYRFLISVNEQLDEFNRTKGHVYGMSSDYQLKKNGGLKMEWEVPVIRMEAGDVQDNDMTVSSDLRKKILKSMPKVNGIDFNIFMSADEIEEVIGFIPYVDICIGKNVNKISSRVLASVSVIRNVFDEPGSQLLEVGVDAFYFSSVHNVSLKHSLLLQIINGGAFCACRKLKKITLNSKQRWITVCLNAFDSGLESLVLEGDTFLGLNLIWFNTLTNMTVYTNNQPFIDEIESKMQSSLSLQQFKINRLLDTEGWL